MGQGGSPLHLLQLLLLLHTGRQVVAEVAQDNIALPQETSRQFILPAPGIRHRPGSPPLLQQEYGPGDNFQHLQSPSGVVGQLLPLEPGVAMAQVVALDVACFPDQMRVRIVFDGNFNGLMYAKGHYSDPQCGYVAPGTGGREFEFVVLAGTCGARYVQGSEEPPFLENIIIIQNEPGIQEVWDTARGVRCVFDSSGVDSVQKVSAGLNVAMLDQEVVSFSAGTQASAFLDIQIGRGPFAASASGLVKIGDMMTLVVAVEGPPNADLLVRECLAHDGSHRDPYQLTDQAGCVLPSRKKLLGSWQKTRDTSDPKVPVIAFSHFQAFKFPDRTDVYIECQVDLCGDGCPVCPEDGVGRRRRAVPVSGGGPGLAEEGVGVGGRNALQKNGSLANEGVRLARRLRVISPHDYSIIGDSPITLVTKESDGREEDMCMSVSTFVVGLAAMLVVLVASSLVTAVLCVRVRTIPSTASTFPPDSSFHAFSTVSGKTV